MNAQDKSAFFMSFATLCTAFSRAMDEALVEVYWRALQEAPLANAQDAINHAIMNDEFMPPPAKLRARAGIARNEAQLDPADEAFLLVADAVKRIGAYSAVDFQDPHIHATIRSLGGWSSLCRSPSSEFHTWTRKRFMAAYRDIKKCTALPAHHTRPLLAAFCPSDNPVSCGRTRHEATMEAMAS